LYVYENEDGEAIIDFAHGGRAFKADSYVILGSVTTGSSAITRTSKERISGRKEGPRGMGNDVCSFGYPGDDIGAINISNTVRRPFVDHLLGGEKYQITLEIKPSVTGADWQIFSPVTYADGTSHRGITANIDSTKLQFEAGTASVYRYIKSDGTSSDVTAASIRGRIVRLD